MGERIRFAFQLNRPGYVAIVNKDSTGKRSLIFPHLYYQMLGKSRTSYRVRSRAWKMLPPASLRSRAWFYMKGKPGRESVELLAAPTRRALASLIRAGKTKSFRAIGVAVQQVRKKPRVVRALIPYTLTR